MNKLWKFIWNLFFGRGKNFVVFLNLVVGKYKRIVIIRE